MRRSAAFLVLTLLAFSDIGCSRKQNTEAAETGADPQAHAQPSNHPQLYQCSMHPNVISDRPAKCPICRMTLQPVKQVESKGIAGRAPVQLSELQQQLINIRVVPVERAEAANTIEAVGNVTYDETRVADLNSKVKGWVQKLYVDKPGQTVKAGEPLLQLYSPELYSAQQEYLLAFKDSHNSAGSVGLSAEMRVFSARNNKAQQSLLEAARKRLELWDITDAQIKELQQSGKPKDTLELAAPMSGVAVEKTVLPGEMITPGLLLYRIADLSEVWIEAEVYEYELGQIKVGQPVTISVEAYPGKTFQGEVAFIYPYLQNKTRTTKVRIALRNPERLLKPGMYVRVELESHLGDQLMIPASAVFDTGRRQYVFVQTDEGIFAPKEIQTGARNGERVVVTQGLTGDEQVVVDGNFLLDSESQLAGAAEAGMKIPEGKEGHRH